MTSTIHIYRNYLVVLASLMGLLLTACENERIGLEGTFPVNLNAGIDADKRIAMDNGYRLTWEDGDQLQLLAIGTGGTTVVTDVTLQTVDAGLARGKFSGTLTIDETPATCLFATETGSVNGNTWVFDYATQDGTHRPYLVGTTSYHATLMNCQLRHVGGLLELTVPSGISSLTISGNAKEALSPVTADAAGNVSVSGSTTSITVTPASGTTYVAMPPVHFTKGILITLHHTNGSVQHRSFSSDGGDTSGYDFSNHRGTVLSIDLSDYTAKTFTVGATASHTKDASGCLNGTEVSMTWAKTGIPNKIIDEWGAVLEDAGGVVKRTYSNQSDVASKVVMSDNTSAWPYLPQGSYTLKPYYVMNGEKIELPSQTVTVPAPTFTVSTSAYTSYSKYLQYTNTGTAGYLTEANSCAPETVYDVKASVSISDELLTHSNYSNIRSSTASYDDATTNFTAHGSNTIAIGNQTGQSWEAHTVNASMTFDGVSQSHSTTVHVTGLPYTADPPRNTGYKPWEILSQSGGYLSFEDDYVLLKTDSKKPAINSSPFHIPGNINIYLHCNYKKNNGSLGSYKYTVGLFNYTGSSKGNDITSHKSNDKGTYDLYGESTLTTTYNAIYCHYDYAALGNTVNVNSITINYR